MLTEPFDSIEIPEEFFSYDTGAPFEKCIVCEKKVRQKNEVYLVEKAYKQYPGFKAKDVIFEYAMCMNCAQTLRNELSEESLRKIDQFMMQRVDMIARNEELSEVTTANIEPWISHCMVSGKPRENCSEYQIHGICENDRLVFMNSPFIISDEVMNEMSMLLSNDTLGQMDDFIDRYLGPPEDVKEVLGKPKWILV